MHFNKINRNLITYVLIATGLTMAFFYLFIIPLVLEITAKHLCDPQPVFTVFFSNLSSDLPLVNYSQMIEKIIFNMAYNISYIGLSLFIVTIIPGVLIYAFYYFRKKVSLSGMNVFMLILISILPVPFNSSMGMSYLHYRENYCRHMVNNGLTGQYVFINLLLTIILIIVIFILFMKKSRQDSPLNLKNSELIFIELILTIIICMVFPWTFFD